MYDYYVVKPHCVVLRLDVNCFLKGLIMDIKYEILEHSCNTKF